MKKKIEFDANARCGAKPDHHPTGYIPVPDDLYKWFSMHVVDNQIESVKRFHVTLSPVEDPELDYKAMWKGIKRFIKKKEDLPQGRWFWKDMMAELKRLEAKHTLQAGVKKEEL